MNYNYNKSNKILYCINCNKKGHHQKKCIYPLISNGLISFKIDNFENDKINDLQEHIYNRFNVNRNTLIDNLSKIVDINNINKDIKFLLVQRKNSLGYKEFLRGKYNENIINCDLENENLNNPSVNYLIKQMTENEINNILNKEFDDLWNEMWNSSGIHNQYHFNEYTNSKSKFYNVRIKYKKEEFEKSIYNFNEWGFPKGRRNKNENDLDSAIREFNEETNINKDDLEIFIKCKFLRENLTGTNGVKYIHNYYLSYLNNYENNKIDDYEIGDIKLYSLDEILKIFRPYHIEKIKIIKTMYLIINDYLNK